MSARLGPSRSEVGRPDLRAMGVTVTVTGALAQALGLAIDLWSHAADPTLAAREGPLTLSNIGHLYLVVGLCLMVLGAALALGGPHLYAHRSAPAAGWLRAAQRLIPPLLVAALVAGVWAGTTWSEAATAAHEHSDALATNAGGALSLPATAATPAALEERAAQEFVSQLAVARSAAARYSTVAAAEAAGYRRITAYATRMGAHYFYPPFAARFDPAAPSMLLFDGIKPESRLTALSYYVESAVEPEGFAGGFDHWHNHAIPACVVSGPDLAPRDTLSLSLSECERRNALFFNGQGTWMLHAWVADRSPNPAGLFAETNPTLP